MDEVHTYVQQKKNYCWIWISVDRIGRRFFDFVLGSRGAETGVILFAKVFINNQSALYMTDYWKAYSEFIPSGLHVLYFDEKPSAMQNQQ